MGDRRVAHVDARRVREPRSITLFPQNPSLVYQTGQQCTFEYSHFSIGVNGAIFIDASSRLNNVRSHLCVS